MDEYHKFINNNVIKFGLVDYNKMKYGETVLLKNIKEKYLDYAFEKIFEELPIDINNNYCFVAADIRASSIFFDQYIVYLYKIDVLKIYQQLMKNFNKFSTN